MSEKEKRESKSRYKCLEKQKPSEQETKRISNTCYRAEVNTFSKHFYLRFGLEKIWFRNITLLSTWVFMLNLPSWIFMLSLPYKKKTVTSSKKYKNSELMIFSSELQFQELSTTEN